MHLFDAFDIPIRLHWLFLAALGASSLWFLSMGGLTGLTWGLTLGFVLFGTVVLHELGHAMAARHYGIKTEHITLYPWGGVAAIRGMPREPRQEFVIAIAGPAVNFVLFVIFGFLFWAFGTQTLVTIAGMNLVMGVFNLIPAFPMDGGRMLRALLARKMGWYPASRLSIRIGTGFAWFFLAVGLYYWNPSLAMVGGFLLFALAAEKRQLVWMMANDLGWRTGFTPPSWGFSRV